MINYGLIIAAVFYFASGVQFLWSKNYPMAAAMFCWAVANVALNVAVNK